MRSVRSRAYRGLNIINTWLYASGYTQLTIARLLRTSTTSLPTVLRSPELYLTIEDMSRIAVACDRSLAEVICAVIADEVQAGRFMSWYEG